MKTVWPLRWLTIVGCLVLVVVLWRYWASICNESCGVVRALSMQALSVMFPASIGLTVFVCTSEKRTARARRASIALSVLLAISFDR